MVPKFKIHFTAHIAEGLLYGYPNASEPGLLDRWVGQMIDHFDRPTQREFAKHARSLLGFSVRAEVLLESCLGR